jgi:hypothetical protein
VRGAAGSEGRVLRTGSEPESRIDASFDYD